ncbi:uncharacterized protein A1O5_06220 [Cladophialophora psammophila CBS 110553]|uniref:Major facilitator superfamily (MFS) profile domain-containing protein n=1 Tax=Cladophialophora psammophila CBS 110553 TaxID=1182543 RepID=W9WPN0_9EURO|nr:uncharacterized protein A1O5_06220 [Cladophialophora psammophila CBS 110553]EXJ70152.1 hypothetical protein A1O5_06220 [Cladophialophora psammophila CBS 110553]
MVSTHDEALDPVDYKMSSTEKTIVQPFELADDKKSVTELEHVDITNKHAFKGDDSDGSQLPLYFVGGALSLITADINATEGEAWLGVSNSLAVAVVAPFCGCLQDLFGRRNVALAGCVLVIVGSVVMGTRRVLQIHIEDAILDRAWACTWRWCMWISCIWVRSATVSLLFFYFPHTHNRAEGVSTKTLSAFTGALAVNNPTNPKLVTALLSVASFGIGGVLVPTATVAITATPDTIIGTTAALSLCVRLGGGAIAYSIYYNILADKLQAK